MGAGRAPLAWSGGNRARGEVAAGVAGQPSISPLALGGALPPATPLPPRTPAHRPTIATQGRSPGQQGAGWGLLRAARAPQPDSCGLSAPLRTPGRAHTAPPPTPLPTTEGAHFRAPTGGDGGLRGVCTRLLRPSARVTEPHCSHKAWARIYNTSEPKSPWAPPSHWVQAPRAGQKEAKFRRPSGLEWGRTAQGAGGCDLNHSRITITNLCHIPLWTGGAVHGDDR